MNINSGILTPARLSAMVATLALAASCSGGYEMDGEFDEFVGDDPRQGTAAEADETALASLSALTLTDDASHTQQEIEAYRALLAEYGGPVAVNKVGGSCGSGSSFSDQVVTGFLPPDHFPPDSIVGLPIAAATAACLLGGVAEFHSAGCDAHDKCYATRGRTRESCDGEFRSNLRAECDRTYNGFFRPCRSPCKAVAQAMYEAVAAYGAGAYDDAQKHPIGSSAPPRAPNPACLAQCEANCISLPYDQIGQCQVGCPDACR